MNIASSTPIAKYAERKERNPRVAIFDYFAEKGEKPNHGDQVEEIVRRTTGLEDQFVQNYQNAYSRKTSAEDVFKAVDSKTAFLETLRSYTIESVTGFYDATRQNLETVMSAERNKVRVINQSQSQCAARISNPFVSKILKDDEFRMKMKDVFGLPERAHIDTVAEAFLGEVQGIFDRSTYIAQARNKYLETAKKAHDSGIAHVVTAGNLGKLTAHWEKNGIDAPKNAYRSVLANEYTTVIGATASQGTITTRDDKAATFTSVYAGTEFAMHGVNVEVLTDDPTQEAFSNGTSFAAPQATALIYEMFDTNPNLTVPEMENILYKSTIPVSGTSEQVGAGQIDPERAMYLAEQSKFIKGESFAALAEATHGIIAV
ncbi:MAG: S8 family serine peptidase [Vulcanimicrobiota bacterium]